ncbi:RNA polymerase sigma factor [Spirillospora sp. CA-255316]
MIDHAAQGSLQVEAWPDEPVGEDAAWALGLAASSAEQEVLRCEPAAELAAARRQLTAPQHAVIFLLVEEECSYQEVADLLGIAVGSVATHRARALDKLSAPWELVEAWSPDAEPGSSTSHRRRLGALERSRPVRSAVPAGASVLGAALLVVLGLGLVLWLATRRAALRRRSRRGPGSAS